MTAPATRTATDANVPALRPAATARPLTQRSAVTNGKRPFVDGNGNAAWTRRWRDLVTAHEQDLSGGADLSEAQSSLIRRVATIEIELEQLEGKLSKGEAVDLDGYTRAASHLRRILETLGLKRVAKPVMSLTEHLARLAQLPPSPDDDDGDACVGASPEVVADAEPAT